MLSEEENVTVWERSTKRCVSIMYRPVIEYGDSLADGMTGVGELY